MNTIEQIKNSPVFRSFMSEEMPVAGSVFRHWDNQCPADLLAAMSAVLDHGANPWCFVADRSHFEQFSGAEDIAAMNALTDEQASALLTWDRADLWW
ncbi:hypothetical protein [Ectothiorhodospira shaposhnikovii]|uniref:hypothetical protein n=1 Tax=Ectothiorhodospira shaposhnikovii TaxID=1054 RepID=UPI001EE92FE5|nr:hypothetical protein [Ectothiorhodospira shaposhnikovii]MCG5512824.1 hypothetical protein [Ectothiorhodospira shaposhnikovii]